MPRRPDLPCADCGTLLWRSTTSLPAGQARCRPCRAARPPEHSWKKSGRCDCAECNAKWNAYCRERHAKRKAEGRPYVHEDRQRRECSRCGSLARLTYRDRPACEKCATRARRRYLAAARQIAKAAEGGRVSRAVLIQGHCARCDEYFVRRGAASAYCSKMCHQKARREFISPAARRAIYERDNWTCWLCGEAVDRAAHYLDNWFPSLDHVECQSWALVPDHSPENLRTAHRWCNSVRGDETHHNPEVLRVSA